MTDESITLETDIADEDAAAEIEKAVGARHSIARRYVLRLRRRNPEATPAELIKILERRYASSITTAGVAITAAGIAANVGIGLIPIVGGAAAGVKAAGAEAAKHAAKEVAKASVKEATKSAAKGLALDAAKGGASRVAGLLPAGEQQLQFEITAIFGLALADIHGIQYDKDQAHALVFGLTNERVSPQQIARMASDVAGRSADVATPTDRTRWAATLSEALPGGAAKSLVRTMQTGHLDSVRESMTGKQQAAVDYGVAAVAGGVTRFVFGRDVINASRAAFPEAPDSFPDSLAVPLKDEDDHEPNRALAALEGAGGRIADVAGTIGGGVATGASAVGSGVATAAGAATRVFRSVDLVGDGIPDEARALTAVKGAGGAVADAAGAVGGRVSGLFKRGKRSAEATDEALVGE